jgi:hypothetical protein
MVAGFGGVGSPASLTRALHSSCVRDVIEGRALNGWQVTQAEIPRLSTELAAAQC